MATARRVGELDEGAGELRHGDVEPEFGANVTYGLTSNLTLDATYNPDFSQVEADAGQIAVNERFALFFPETRPFFLEGTEIFSLPEQLVYTRSIVDPVFGAKLTGKIGSLNVGYLGAVDEVGDEPSDAVVNLVRARQDLGASSTAGLVYTDRTRAGDDYNRVGAPPPRRYTVTLRVELDGRAGGRPGRQRLGRRERDPSQGSLRAGGAGTLVQRRAHGHRARVRGPERIPPPHR